MSSPIGLPIRYTVPPHHWLVYGNGTVLAGLITGMNADGTANLVVFPRFRPAEHIENVEMGGGIGECQIAGGPADEAPIADPAPADPAAAPAA